MEDLRLEGRGREGQRLGQGLRGRVRERLVEDLAVVCVWGSPRGSASQFLPSLQPFQAKPQLVGAAGAGDEGAQWHPGLGVSASGPPEGPGAAGGWALGAWNGG